MAITSPKESFDNDIIGVHFLLLFIYLESILYKILVPKKPKEFPSLK